MSQMCRKNILILDPERDTIELFVRALESRGDCKCYFACKGEEAIDLLKDITFDLVLLDMSTGMAGEFSLLKKIRRLFPHLVIVMDAYLHQKEFVTGALSLGAHGYIFKPIKVDSFRKKIDDFFSIVTA